jgi:hypothetical protein
MNEQEAKARQKAYNEYLSNFDGENAGKFMDAAFQFVWSAAMDYSQSDGEQCNHEQVEIALGLCDCHEDKQLTRYRTALEDLPKQIPKSWLDPLLSGPDKVSLENSDCREIEALLRGIQDRLRKFASEALEGK